MTTILLRSGALRSALLFAAALSAGGCMNTANFDPVCPAEAAPGDGLSRRDFERVGARSLLDVLRGRVSGLDVRTVRGRPFVVIRGAGSFATPVEPIVVLDGVRLARRGAEGINSVNTQDVATVEVLKDASDLSFYGMEGGAGVVRIATRRSGCD